MVVYLDGGVNVSFSIVAVNNAGQRSDPAFGQLVTYNLSECHRIQTHLCKVAK